MDAEDAAVTVAVRVRGPAPAGESAVEVVDGKSVKITPEGKAEHWFTFDYAFDHATEQDEVYQKMGAPLAPVVLKGVNATLFAYGQTGSGKTHTMLGKPGSPGVMLRTIHDVFEQCKAKEDQHTQYAIEISYVEVYNEHVRDLLGDGEGLEIRESMAEGTYILGCSSHKVVNLQDVTSLMLEGDKRRTTEATKANVTSSRSHAVLTITVQSSGLDGRRAKLSLIDLAGSEKAKKTEASGQRLQEGASINRSLLALGNCISALGGKGRRGGFVNFRDSKLTRLLKESLGGNCKTSMVATLRMDLEHVDESLSTLKYANRAKNIKTTLKVNYTNTSSAKAEKFKATITELRDTIHQLQTQLMEKRLERAGLSQLPQLPDLHSGEKLSDQQLQFQDKVVLNFSTRKDLRMRLHNISNSLRPLLYDMAHKESKMRQFERMLDSGESPAPSAEEIAQVKDEHALTLQAIHELHEEGSQRNEELKENEKAASEFEDEAKGLENAEPDQFGELVAATCRIERELMRVELQAQLREKILEDMFAVIDERGLTAQLPERTLTLLRKNQIIPQSEGLIEHVVAEALE